MDKHRTKENQWGELILRYLGKICVYCGSTDKLHIHHILPLYRGGKNEMGNVEVVCPDCHFKIHKTWRTFLPYKKKKIIYKCPYCERYVEKKIKVRGFNFLMCDECKQHQILRKNRIKNKHYKNI